MEINANERTDFYAVIFISRKLETKFPVEIEDYQDGVWNSKEAGSNQSYD